MRFLWPFPDFTTLEDKQKYEKEDKEALKRISDLQGFRSSQLDGYLQASQRIIDYEDKRKAGAETRATTYIAAIATLIPLMTWALGNTTPFCSSSYTCGAWSATFNISIIYFVFAAYWCLRTLAVANYHTIGVEELVEIKEHQKSLGKELVIQSMKLARANRETINRKLDFIKTAQRCFFLGLMVLAGLLALDPWFRLGAQASLNASPITEKTVSAAENKSIGVPTVASKALATTSAAAAASSARH